MKKLTIFSMIAAAGLAVAACGKPAQDNAAASNGQVGSNEGAAADSSADAPLLGNDGDVIDNTGNASGL